MAKLTPKQERFCDEYLIDLNATQAAIRAGYSAKTARQIATVTLSKDYIQEHIVEKQKERAKKAGITQEMVLEGYRRLAFYDSRKFYNAEGNLLAIPDLDEETAFALAGFEVQEEKATIKGNVISTVETKKVKMSDRKAGLDGICKVLGYFAPSKVANTDKEGNDVPVYDYSKLTTEELLLLKEINKKCATTPK